MSITAFFIGLFLVYINNKKIASNNYKKLSKRRLKNEIIMIFNRVSILFNKHSDYTLSQYKNHNDLLEKITFYKVKLKAKETDYLLSLTSHNTTNYLFQKLAKQNNWSHNQMQLLLRLDLLLIEYHNR